MKLDRFLKRFTGSTETPETSGQPPAPVPALRFADAHIAELEHVRRALVETRAALARAESRWEAVKARDDPEAHEARLGVGPRLLELRATMRRLTLDEQRLEQTISETARQVEVYAVFAVETTTRFRPVFDAVAQLTPAAIRDIYTASRELDRMANDALARTGDRTAFRRPVCDPFRDLKDALTECVKQLDRQRLLSRVDAAKTGTDAR